MNELTDERLAELRAIAEADVTPGPWRVALDAPCFLSVVSTEGWDVAACGDEVTKHSSEDAHFIATFDPPTVLALLAELGEARQRLAKVERIASGSLGLSVHRVLDAVARAARGEV